MRKLYYYAHTHWDREWYQPFESFRAQLVPVVEKIVSGLENGSLPRFYMDGQSIIFDDVLEIVPALEPRLRSIMHNGKLSAGPWYVLADQLLVSGESLVRNLYYGLEGIRRFGNPAMIGYCPDTFGHSADLPRILNGFGIENAAVWRGVPMLEMGPLFWWYSPDGSKVLTYHLTHGYYQTLVHEASHQGDEALTGLIQTLLPWVDMSPSSNGDASSYYKHIDGALLPIGGDHMGPPSNLTEILKQINEQLHADGAGLKLVDTTLPEFLLHVRNMLELSETAIVQKIEGELRYNQSASHYARSYLLGGVLSSRLYLKRANRLSEYKLARMIEPLATIAHGCGASHYPHSEMQHAWKLLLKNHPHDSICGCSVDAVHREMMIRTERLCSITNSLLERTAASIAGPAPQGLLSHADPEFGNDTLAVFNTTATPVTAPIFMRWTEKAGHSSRWTNNPNVQVTQIRSADRLFSGWGSVPYYKQVDELEGWIWPGEVPAFGGTTVDWPPSTASAPAAARRNQTDDRKVQGPLVDEVPGDIMYAVTSAQAESNASKKAEQSLCMAKNLPAVSVRNNRMSNGLLEVSIAADGDISAVQYIAGERPRVFNLRHRIRDVGDGGDSYNFDPIPEDKPLRARVVSIKAGQRGPIAGSVLITYEIDIPQCAETVGPLRVRDDADAHKIQVLKRSRHKIKHQITTEVILKRGVPIIFFETKWENHSSDHRLEVVFDTGKPVKETCCENHFSVLHRHHDKAGSKQQKLPVAVAHEAPPDRFPCQRFFIANDQVFFNTGMPEYGIDDSLVSLTMLRAFSWLSKPRLWTRGGGAGPNLETPEGNCKGLNECSYGWAPLMVASPNPRKTTAQTPASNCDHPFAQAYALSELYEGTLWAVPTRADWWQAGTFSFLAANNPAIRLVSAHLAESPEKEAEKDKVLAGSKHASHGSSSSSIDNTRQFAGDIIVRLLNVSPHPQRCTLKYAAEKFTTASLSNLAGDNLEELPATAALDEKAMLAQLEFSKAQLITVRLRLRSGKESEKRRTEQRSQEIADTKEAIAEGTAPSAADTTSATNVAKPAPTRQATTKGSSKRRRKPQS